MSNNEERSLKNQQTAGALYTTFVNAFSYTLAISTVDRMVDTGNHDLLVLAAATALGITLLTRIRDEVEVVHDNLKAPETRHINQLTDGPLRMLLFMLSTSVSVLVQFLSSALGKWAIDIAGTTTATVIPTVVVGTALLWLLGAASGLRP